MILICIGRDQETHPSSYSMQCIGSVVFSCQFKQHGGTDSGVSFQDTNIQGCTGYQQASNLTSSDSILEGHNSIKPELVYRLIKYMLTTKLANKKSENNSLVAVFSGSMHDFWISVANDVNDVLNK